MIQTKEKLLLTDNGNKNKTIHPDVHNNKLTTNNDSIVKSTTNNGSIVQLTSPKSSSTNSSSLSSTKLPTTPLVKIDNKLINNNTATNLVKNNNNNNNSSDSQQLKIDPRLIIDDKEATSVKNFNITVLDYQTTNGTCIATGGNHAMKIINKILRECKNTKIPLINRKKNSCNQTILLLLFLMM